MTDISLVVLQHGLWGKSSHMNYIEQSFSAQFKNDSTVIIVSSRKVAVLKRSNILMSLFPIVI